MTALTRSKARAFSFFRLREEHNMFQIRVSRRTRGLAIDSGRADSEDKESILSLISLSYGSPFFRVGGNALLIVPQLLKVSVVSLSREHGENIRLD
jgi:hypothetical protein